VLSGKLMLFFSVWVLPLPLWCCSQTSPNGIGLVDSKSWSNTKCSKGSKYCWGVECVS